jgi:hypothetical protein
MYSSYSSYIYGDMQGLHTFTCTVLTLGFCGLLSLLGARTLLEESGAITIERYGDVTNSCHITSVSLVRKDVYVRKVYVHCRYHVNWRVIVYLLHQVPLLTDCTVPECNNYRMGWVLYPSVHAAGSCFLYRVYSSWILLCVLASLIILFAVLHASWYPLLYVLYLVHVSCMLVL